MQEVAQLTQGVKEVSPVESSSSISGEEAPKVKVVVDSYPVTRHAIETALIGSGLPQHDLDCLRAFYLELVDKYFGKTDEESVFVSNEDISVLMRSAFRLGRARGLFGNIYSSRIRPFAERTNVQGKNGWNFSKEKVLPFIEGLRRIPKMACPHPHTVHVPPPLGANGNASFLDVHEGKKATPLLLDDKPVKVITGEDVERLIEDELFSDADLLKSVTLLLQAREKASEELEKLREVEWIASEEVKELERMLAEKRAVLLEAQASVESLQKKVDKLQVSPAVKQKVREAKNRVDELSRLLGE